MEQDIESEITVYAEFRDGKLEINGGAELHRVRRDGKVALDPDPCHRCVEDIDRQARRGCQSAVTATAIIVDTFWQPASPTTP